MDQSSKEKHYKGSRDTGSWWESRTSAWLRLWQVKLLRQAGFSACDSEKHSAKQLNNLRFLCGGAPLLPNYQLEGGQDAFNDLDYLTPKTQDCHSLMENNILYFGVKLISSQIGGF